MSGFELLLNNMRREMYRVMSRWSRRTVGKVSAVDPDKYAAKYELQPDSVGGKTIETGWIPLPTSQTGKGYGHHVIPNVGDFHWLLPHEFNREGLTAAEAMFNDIFKPKKGLKEGEKYYEHKKGSSNYHKDDGSVEIQDKGGAKIVMDGKSKITIGPKDGEVHQVATKNGLAWGVFAVMSNGGGNDNTGAEGGTQGGQGGDPLPVIGGGSGRKTFPPGIVTADQQNPFNSMGGMLGGMLAIGQQDSQGNQTVPQARALKQDASLAADGTITVTASKGVPLATSATVDTTDATNIFNVFGVLLNTIKITNAVAAVQDTTSLTNPYRAFLIVYENVLPTTDGPFLQLQYSTNGGVSYLNSAYPQSGLVWSSAVSTQNSVTTGIQIAPNASNLAGYGISGHGTIYNPSSSTTRKVYTGTCVASKTGGNQSIGGCNAAGYQDGSNLPVNALQWSFTAGNIATGTIQVFGIGPIGISHHFAQGITMAEVVSLVAQFVKAGSQPVTPGSASFTTPGTFIFTVPFYNTLMVTVSGPSGGGGAAWQISSPSPSTAGGPESSFETSPPLIAGSGGAGASIQAPSIGSNVFGANGAPGQALDGDTNTTGGGAVGGEGGGYRQGHGGKGGNGALCIKTWKAGAAGAPVSGGSVSLTVGAHGVGAHASTGASGQNGLDGSVTITWN